MQIMKIKLTILVLFSLSLSISPVNPALADGSQAVKYREYISVDVDPSAIIDQDVYSNMACGPTSALNALQFGNPQLQAQFRQLRGRTHTQKLKNVIIGLGDRPSVVEQGTLYNESSGMKADDMLPFMRALLPDSPYIKGMYFDRQQGESSDAHLKRIHRQLKRSLAVGVPVVTSLRSFAAQPDNTGYKWQGVAAHFISITGIPAQLRPGQRGFSVEYIEPGTGKLASAYLHTETVRDFLAIKGSGKTGWEWQGNSPFLIVVAPDLDLDLSKQNWHDRAFMTLNYGVGAF